jgi:hypothetical protein
MNFATAPPGPAGRIADRGDGVTCHLLGRAAQGDFPNRLPAIALADGATQRRAAGAVQLRNRCALDIFRVSRRCIVEEARRRALGFTAWQIVLPIPMERSGSSANDNDEPGHELKQMATPLAQPALQHFLARRGRKDRAGENIHRNFYRVLDHGKDQLL